MAKRSHARQADRRRTNRRINDHLHSHSHDPVVTGQGLLASLGLGVGFPTPTLGAKLGIYGSLSSLLRSLCRQRVHPQFSVGD